MHEGGRFVGELRVSGAYRANREPALTFHSPSQSWNDQLRHYEKLARSSFGWEHLDRYCRLVSDLAASPHAGHLYALRSHDFLVISPTKGWVKRGPTSSDRSRIIIRPCQDGRVSLTLAKKRPGQTLTAETVETTFDEARTVLEPWIEWLRQEARELEEDNP